MRTSTCSLKADGKPIDPSLYIPAYVRRYPFLLAADSPGQRRAVALFDPTANAVGKFKEGEELFDGEQPSQVDALAILEFCEQFEAAGQRTSAFMEELTKIDLVWTAKSRSSPKALSSPSSTGGFGWSTKRSFASFAATSFRADEEERHADDATLIDDQITGAGRKQGRPRQTPQPTAARSPAMPPAMA